MDTEQEQTNKKYQDVPKDKVLIYDVETTGLSYEDDEILQLSIIDGTGKVLFNEYIKPTHWTLWEQAEAIHHISPEMVADKPPIAEYRNILNNIFQSAELLVGYNNIGFDDAFIENADISLPEDALQYDVMLEFAPIYGEWSDHHQSYKWQKLVTCADYYGFDWDSIEENAHNSLGDCYATLHCFNHMIDAKIPMQK